VSAAVAAVVLVVLCAPLAYLNLYFVLLAREGWEAAAERVGIFVRACGLAGGTCAVVARTRWARLLFGVPNSMFGLVWCGLLVWLAVTWLATGVIAVPWWALAGAGATVIAAVVLIYAQVVRLKQPCPL
jgi:uncharacterized membrane protein